MKENFRKLIYLKLFKSSNCPFVQKLHVPIPGDYDGGRFISQLMTTQAAVIIAIENEDNGMEIDEEDAEGVPEGARTDDDSEDEARGVATPLAAVAAGEPATALSFADLSSETEFFKRGLGQDGSMIILSEVEGQPIATDRGCIQRLLLRGCESHNVYDIVSNIQFDGPAASERQKRKRYRLTVPEVRVLLEALCTQYPRIAIYNTEEDTIRYRAIPADEATQIKVHNELMQAAYIDLRKYSQCRYQFLRKKGPVPEEAGAEGAVQPASSRARQNVDQRVGSQAGRGHARGRRRSSPRASSAAPAAAAARQPVRRSVTPPLGRPGLERRASTKR